MILGALVTRAYHDGLELVEVLGPLRNEGKCGVQRAVFRFECEVTDLRYHRMKNSEKFFQIMWAKAELEWQPQSGYVEGVPLSAVELDTQT